MLNGQKSKLVSDLSKDMKLASKSSDYEQAGKLRDQITALKDLDKKILFSDKEFMDLSKDHALIELTELLGLPKVPKRIEGYDISHMSGTDVVASMVVFTNGVADKANYRKFKSRIPGNDDFAHMSEVMQRRFSEKNIKLWGKPDFILIDGGKGQLGAALKVLNQLEINIPTVGLAKKYEEIILDNSLEATTLNVKSLMKLRGFSKESTDYTSIDLPNNSNLVKLFQRIRDESHRFAVSYHSVLKVKRQTASLLDEVPGIGPTTKKKLIKHFGSLSGVKQAKAQELETVVGKSKSKILIKYLEINN